MIQVHRPHSATPASLKGKSSAGVLERAAAIAYFTSPRKRKEEFEFAAFGRDDVRAALAALFYDKCAYCEDRLSTQTPAVEHYRPKKGYAGPNKKLVKPGYWWLAAEWSNLIPSCTSCNGKKLNHFPLAAPGRRWLYGKSNRERPLLLDPCRDHPHKHLRFNEGVLVGKDQRGKITIEILGLNRRVLVDDRRGDLRKLAMQTKSIERLSRLRRRYPRDRMIKKELAETRRELKGFVGPKERFSAMVEQFIRTFLRKLEP